MERYLKYILCRCLEDLPYNNFSSDRNLFLRPIIQGDRLGGNCEYLARYFEEMVKCYLGSEVVRTRLVFGGKKPNVTADLLNHVLVM